MLIDPDLARLVTAPSYAVLTTLDRHGAPSSHVTWIDCTREHVLVNTEMHRQKVANVERDPRVAVTVLDATSPYMFMEVRGSVVGMTLGHEARAHIDELAQRYTGAPYAPPIVSERVILRIEVRRLYKKALSAWHADHSSPADIPDREARLTKADLRHGGT